jgi:hypothetical protein
MQHSTVACQQRPNIRQKKPDITQKRPNIRQKRPDIRQKRPDIRQKRPNVRQKRPDIRQKRPDIRQKRLSGLFSLTLGLFWHATMICWRERAAHVIKSSRYLHRERHTLSNYKERGKKRGTHYQKLSISLDLEQKLGVRRYLVSSI